MQQSTTTPGMSDPHKRELSTNWVAVFTLVAACNGARRPPRTTPSRLGDQAWDSAKTSYETPIRSACKACTYWQALTKSMGLKGQKSVLHIHPLPQATIYTGAVCSVSTAFTRQIHSVIQ